MEADAIASESVEGQYEGFYSVIVCQNCDYDNHVEGDVSSGDKIECEGCQRKMEVTGR